MISHSADTVAIDFTSDGVSVSLNGEVRDNPVDASLKKALLGH